MSTRCQIAFYDDEDEKDLSKFNALIYRHSDGYPEGENGVLHDILPFLKWFKKERGLEDMEYTSARLLQWLCNVYDKETKDYEEEKGEAGYTGILGHGISKDFHWDIAYLYAIYCDRIDIYEIGGVDMKNEKGINELSKKIKTIKID